MTFDKIIEKDGELYTCEIERMFPFKLRDHKKIKDLPPEELMNVLISVERKKNYCYEQYEEFGKILSGPSCSKEIISEQNDYYEYFIKYKELEEKIWQIKKEKDNESIYN